VGALSNNTSIAEICRNNNVFASTFYKWRDSFIAAGTAALEAGRSSRHMKNQMEIENPKRIIGELITASETLEKSTLQEECDDFPCW
jgi:transposase-like protein